MYPERLHLCADDSSGFQCILFKQAGIQALHSSLRCLKYYWERRSALSHRQYCMIEIPVSPYTQGDIISSFCSLADSCKFSMSNVDMIQASILSFLLGISVTWTFAVFSPEKLVCIAGSSIMSRIWLCFYAHSAFALLVLAVRIVEAHFCSFKRLARCALTSCPRLLSSLGENSITSSWYSVNVHAKKDTKDTCFIAAHRT
ncbi:hypothetical protein EDB19DRAFT_681613 [Suillus lakei]|nr:hypothetical protein EDB19DRAFT_681613 [Suillus lakei]